MDRESIFVSYDYDNDRNYKNMLLAWDKNDEFDFAFRDHSADVSIQSTDTDAIKRAISTKINSATHFLCIVGSKTVECRWVAWEIEKAKALDKRLVAVKTAPDNKTPNGLLNAGASWAMSFTFDAIKKAIKSA
jgi:hypothetical protein